MADPGVPPMWATPPLRSDIPHRRRRAAGEALRVHCRRWPEAPPKGLAAVAHELGLRSRRAQGLEDEITDPVVLDLVARLVVLVTSTDEAPHAGVPP
jgi:hypothetical protein